MQRGSGLAASSRCAVEGDFAVHHDRGVAASHKELPGALARAGELSPPQLSVGILFTVPQFLPFEIESHLAESALGRPAHGVFMVLQLDHSLPLLPKLVDKPQPVLLWGSSGAGIPSQQAQRGVRF